MEINKAEVSRCDTSTFLVYFYAFFIRRSIVLQYVVHIVEGVFPLILLIEQAAVRTVHLVRVVVLRKLRVVAQTPGSEVCELAVRAECSVTVDVLQHVHEICVEAGVLLNGFIVAVVVADCNFGHVDFNVEFSILNDGQADVFDVALVHATGLGAVAADVTLHSDAVAELAIGSVRVLRIGVDVLHQVDDRVAFIGIEGVVIVVE